jgi:hypothetical protein
MLRLQLSCSQPRQRLLRQSRERATWCIAGMGMAFCRLPLARTDRMGTGAKSRPGLLVWWPGLLSRALDRWRIRPVLDADADRECMELRSIGDRDQTRIRNGLSGDTETGWSLTIWCHDHRSRRGDEQSRSLADLNAAYSPTVRRPHAPPNQIAAAPIVVVAAVAVGITVSVAVRTIKSQTQTDPQPRAAKATTTETTAAETAATTTSATGEGSCAGGSQQESRCADDAEAIDAEQSQHRQAARQDIAIARSVEGHWFSRSGSCSRTGKIQRQMLGSSHAFGQITSTSSSPHSNRRPDDGRAESRVMRRLYVWSSQRSSVRSRLMPATNDRIAAILLVADCNPARQYSKPINIQRRDVS